MKNKNDIPFYKYVEYTKSIKDNQEDSHVVNEMMRIFFPNRTDINNCIAEYYNAMHSKTPEKRFRGYKVDFNFVKAARFIDADTFYTDREYIDFLKCVLVHKIPFLKLNYKKISLATAENVLALFIFARRK